MKYIQTQNYKLIAQAQLGEAVKSLGRGQFGEALTKGEEFVSNLPSRTQEVADSIGKGVENVKSDIEKALRAKKFKNNIATCKKIMTECKELFLKDAAMWQSSGIYKQNLERVDAVLQGIDKLEYLYPNK